MEMLLLLLLVREVEESSVVFRIAPQARVRLRGPVLVIHEEEEGCLWVETGIVVIVRFQRVLPIQSLFVASASAVTDVAAAAPTADPDVAVFILMLSERVKNDKINKR